MKKMFTMLFSLFICYDALAQDIVVNKLRNETSRTIKKEADTSKWNWKRGGLLSMNLAQGSLSNWASGGDNFSLALSSYFNFFFFYKEGRHGWDNNFDLNLGYVQTTSLGSRKNDDRYDYLSKYGYKIDSTGKLFVSSLFNFRSQLFPGYTYSNNIATLASSFLSPAYIILSIGLDCKPSDKFSVFLSPLTSRWTVVANNTLSSKGKYGVPAGKHSLNERGAFATVNYNNTFARKNVTYKGRLDLFSNYSNGPENVDMFMTNLVSFKINKFFSATYSLDLIYDDDVRLFGPAKTSPGLQIKSLLGIGFLKPLNVKKTLRVAPPPMPPVQVPVTMSAELKQKIAEMIAAMMKW